MTEIADRPNQAVLVVDVQRDVVANAHDADAVIANINTVVDKARDADVAVIWVQHYDDDLPRDSDGWEYVDELQRAEGEPLVHKAYGDSFEATELESILADRDVGHVLVTGAQTDYCIRATLHGAVTRGYNATLVSDAHTTDDLHPMGLDLAAADVIAHTNMYWRGAAAPGRRGGLITAAELDFPD